MAPSLIRRCVAAGLASFASVSTASAMEFDVERVASGTVVLRAEGKIEFEDDIALDALLERVRVDEIWFDSGGGNVTAGQGIGRALRAASLIARVPSDARCASACVDAFLGAPIRFVDDDHSIGIHMFSAYSSEDLRQKVRDDVEAGRPEAAIQFMEEMGAQNTARWIVYMLEMGLAPALITWTVKVPHRCVYWLSRQEMKLFNVINASGPPRPGFKPGRDGKLEGPVRRTETGALVRHANGTPIYEACFE